MLEPYRERGIVDHTKTLSIAIADRIPALIKQPSGRLRISVALSQALASAFKHIKSVKLDADQIVEIAEGIIDTSHEDQLSVEDILLFLKDLLTGKYGKLSGGMDMPTFFDYLEEYRDERYRVLKKQRWEEHLTFKSLGDSNRSSINDNLRKNDDPGAIMDMMQTYYENKNDA